MPTSIPIAVYTHKIEDIGILAIFSVGDCFLTIFLPQNIETKNHDGTARKATHGASGTSKLNLNAGKNGVTANASVQNRDGSSTSINLANGGPTLAINNGNSNVQLGPGGVNFNTTQNGQRFQFGVDGNGRTTFSTSGGDPNSDINQLYKTADDLRSIADGSHPAYVELENGRQQIDSLRDPASPNYVGNVLDNVREDVQTAMTFPDPTAEAQNLAYATLGYPAQQILTDVTGDIRDAASPILSMADPNNPNSLPGQINGTITPLAGILQNAAGSANNMVGSYTNGLTTPLQNITGNLVNLNSQLTGDLQNLASPLGQISSQLASQNPILQQVHDLESLISGLPLQTNGMQELGKLDNALDNLTNPMKDGSLTTYLDNIGNKAGSLLDLNNNSVLSQLAETADSLDDLAFREEQNRAIAAVSGNGIFSGLSDSLQTAFDSTSNGVLNSFNLQNILPEGIAEELPAEDLIPTDGSKPDSSGVPSTPAPSGIAPDQLSAVLKKISKQELRDFLDFLAENGGTTGTAGVLAMLGVYLNRRRKEDELDFEGQENDGDGSTGSPTENTEGDGNTSEASENASMGFSDGLEGSQEIGEGGAQAEAVVIGGNSNTHSQEEIIDTQEDFWLKSPQPYVEDNIELLQNYYYATTEEKAQALLQRIIEKDPNNAELYQQKFEQAISTWHSIPTYEEQMNQLGKPAENVMVETFGEKEPSNQIIAESIQDINSELDSLAEIFQTSDNTFDVEDSFVLVGDNNTISTSQVDIDSAVNELEDYFITEYTKNGDQDKLRKVKYRILSKYKNSPKTRKKILQQFGTQVFAAYTEAVREKNKANSSQDDQILALNHFFRDRKREVRYYKTSGPNGKYQRTTLNKIKEIWNSEIEQEYSDKKERLKNAIEDLITKNPYDHRASKLKLKLQNLKTNLTIERLSEKIRQLDGYDMHPDFIKAICLQEAGGKLLAAGPSAYTGGGFGYGFEKKHSSAYKNPVFSMRFEVDKIDNAFTEAKKNPKTAKLITEDFVKIYRKNSVAMRDAEDDIGKTHDILQTLFKNANSVEKEIILQGSSMGISHLMGFNAEEAGYDSALAMYEDFKSEKNKSSFKQVFATYNRIMDARGLHEVPRGTPIYELSKNMRKGSYRGLWEATLVWNSNDDYEEEIRNRLSDVKKESSLTSEILPGDIPEKQTQLKSTNSDIENTSSDETNSNNPITNSTIIGATTVSPDTREIIGQNTYSPEESVNEDFLENDFISDDLYIQDNVQLLQNYYYATTEVQAKELLQEMIGQDPDNAELYQEKLQEAITAWHDLPTYEERIEKLGKPSEIVMEEQLGEKEPDLEFVKSEIQLNDDEFDIEKLKMRIKELNQEISELKQKSNSEDQQGFIGIGIANATTDPIMQDRTPSSEPTLEDVALKHELETQKIKRDFLKQNPNCEHFIKNILHDKKYFNMGTLNEEYNKLKTSIANIKDIKKNKEIQNFSQKLLRK
ncbi:MAG: N-acetylmuramidase domain-containing protein, partial [Spirochaetota bacterium]